MNRLTSLIAVFLSLILCGCSTIQSDTSSTGIETSERGTVTESATIAHRFATASEGKELLLSNKEYYAGFSQNDLDFRMQKTGATMDEYLAFVAEQALDFTDAEKELIDQHLDEMSAHLTQNGYTLPPLDEIVFVKSTMADEDGAGGYTHGTTVYLSAALLEHIVDNDEDEDVAIVLTEVLWHEIFHVLTRCNPDFRADMYKLIHFDIHDTDYELPPSVIEYHISNPDVEHHDSSAVFSINGSDVECFVDFVTTKHFEKEGDSFFDYGTAALVPVDGTDTYYLPEQAANFNEIFGTNTEYVTDPEECLADNFMLALTFGTSGADGNGYDSPEIIEGILAYLSR